MRPILGRYRGSKFFLPTRTQNFRLLPSYPDFFACRDHENFGGRDGENCFSAPHISPNFGLRAENFFGLRALGVHYRYEFQDPNPKIRVWGNDRKNKTKFSILTTGAYFKSIHLKQY